MPGRVDNAAIARQLFEIADLLEIRGDNPFKIRAYRNAGDTIAAEPTSVAAFDDTALRALPGIGKDLASRIREIAETGDTPYRQELIADFPVTILDLLRLQGVGPKTVKRLYDELGVASLDALEQAARDGRIRAMKGMGSKKEVLILRAIEERRRYAGRHLSAQVAVVASRIVEALAAAEPQAEFVPVGSLRRRAETCGDLDILAVGATSAVMTTFTELPQVTRVLGHGDTKSSVLLDAGLQADLRLVGPDQKGAALQYFTGSKAHNIQLRDRAMARGLRLNEYGLTRLEDGAVIAGADEEGIYEALGLAWVPPELRELRGEFEAAERRTLPALISRSDLKGDLHSHTNETDGKEDLETMARAARARGHEYLAVTDHSQALAMANGLDERRTLAHAAKIRALNEHLDGITLLAGIECDIRIDGTLDLDHECLAALDFVVASVHSGFSLEPAQMTDRLLAAIACPWVDVIGHPTGRLLLRREPLRYDLDAVLKAAAAAGVALEINCQIDRLDVGDTVARAARDLGIPIIISSDAHTVGELDTLEWGVGIARRAWLTPADVLNTRPLAALRPLLRRHRARTSA
jgi:DNA polymerase (family 10)